MASGVVQGFLEAVALAALVAAAYGAVHRRLAVADGRFWTLAGGAAVAVSLYVGAIIIAGDGAWSAGLAPALWSTVATVAVLYLAVAALDGNAVKLAPLLYPYLTLLAVAALAASAAPEGPRLALADAWMVVHIALAVPAYGLLTLAAVSALGVFLQERAIKAKKIRGFSSNLPSVADGEAIEVRLLGASALLLIAALATGMAVEYRELGVLLVLDHKTLFTLLTLAAVGVLLLAHWRTGLRGRRAARGVLVAYLLLTFAFPGVKFVTDVLIGNP
jgi:ABC-type uncharacterized transport system permease subunit